MFRKPRWCKALNWPRRPALRRARRGGRRGLFTLWTILFAPVLVVLFGIVVEVAHLWLARVELENALEAAALAAVKEWGDANGGATLTPREIGVEYAAASTINGTPVSIGTNYNPANPSNENATCGGNLIFGAVLEQPGVTCPEYEFNAGLQPSCGAGDVLFDASEQGNLKTGNNHEWGIAFHRDENTPANLRIKSITYDLGDGTPLYFDVDTGLTLADLADPFKVTDGTVDQPDLFGFPDPGAQLTGQIRWSFDEFDPGGEPRAKQLIFTFHGDGGSGDLGFEPCDRFRFGMNVVKRKGNAQFDGDDIGDYHVTVTVLFTLGGIDLPEVHGTFVNTKCNAPGEPKCLCEFQGNDTFCTNSIIVHDAGIPDLPCPPTPGQGNNPDGQSYVEIQGAGGRAFGVRAQASTVVDSLICRFCGISFGPFSVSACSTAMYDCTERRPRLIRVEAENFICPGPDPP